MNEPSGSIKSDATKVLAAGLAIGFVLGFYGGYLWHTPNPNPNPNVVPQLKDITSTTHTALPDCRLTYSWEIDPIYPNGYRFLFFNSSGAFAQIPGLTNSNNAFFKIQGLTSYSQFTPNLSMAANRSTWHTAPGENLGQSCLISNYPPPEIYWVKAIQ